MAVKTQVNQRRAHITGSFSMIRVLIALLVILLSTDASNAQFNNKKKDFTDINYVFVCSEFVDIDAESVADFYSKVFGRNPRVKFFDGVPVSELDPRKKYVLLSFGIKPLDQKTIDCLKTFPAMEEAWIHGILEQNDIVGNSFENMLRINLRDNPYLEEFIEEYCEKSTVRCDQYEPIHSSTHPFEKENLYVVSNLSKKYSKYGVCVSLASVFQVKYNRPESKVKCGKHGVSYE